MPALRAAPAPVGGGPGARLRPDPRRAADPGGLPGATPRPRRARRPPAARGGPRGPARHPADHDRSRRARATSTRPSRSRERGDGHRVRYAIADVAALVAPGGALDREARARGVTIYMPDRRAPLHPRRARRGRGSLLPGADRPRCCGRSTSTPAVSPCTSTWSARSVRSRRALELRRGPGGDRRRAPATRTLRLLREVGRAAPRARGRPGRREPDRAGAGGRAARATATTCATSAPLAGRGLERADLAPHRHRRGARSWPTGAWASSGCWTPPRRRDLDVAAPQRPGAGRGLAGGRRATGTWCARSTAAGPRDRPSPCGRPGSSTAPDTRSGGAPTGDPPVHAAIASIYAHVTAPLRRLVDRYANEIVLAHCAGVAPPGWVMAGLDAIPGHHGRDRRPRAARGARGRRPRRDRPPGAGASARPSPRSWWTSATAGRPCRSPSPPSSGPSRATRRPGRASRCAWPRSTPRPTGSASSGPGARRALPPLPGDPEDVAAGVAVRGAGQDEEQVREPVEVGERLRGDRLGVGQGHGRALGAAADGARVVQGRGGGAPAGQDEAGEVRERLVDLVAPALEPLDLGGARRAGGCGPPSPGGTQRSAPRSKRSFWIIASHGVDRGPRRRWARATPMMALSSSTSP